jgi:glutaredoxin
MKTAVFYHAGCPVCADAERQIAQSLDPERFEVESVHLGQNRGRIGEAERSGVKSVPALVIDGHPFHINFGAAIQDLRVNGGEAAERRRAL